MKRLLAAFALAGCAIAHAQPFPSKPVRVVVPNPAGGIDTYFRILQPKAVEFLGQPIVIENRPGGAAGSIGAENIAKSAPDGYSLLFSTTAQLVTGQFLNRNLPFDPGKDFTPISRVLEPIEAVVVHAALPVRSIRELIDYAKKNPGKLSFGSSGVGSIPHLDGELFKKAAGVEMLHVPYKGIAQIMPELAAGRIDVSFPGLGSANAMLSAGKVRALAVLDSKRFSGMPDLPSLSETLPGFRQAPIWFALTGPAGLPRPVVDRLNGAVVKALNVPEIRDTYEKGFMKVVGSTPEELAAAIKSDTEFTAGLVKSIGLKPE